MELFTVALMNATPESMDLLKKMLVHELTDEIFAVHRVELELVNSNREIRCVTNNNKFSLPVHGPFVLKKSALAFAKYITCEMEPLLIKTIVNKQYHFGVEEAQKIEQYCQTLLHESQGPSEDYHEILRGQERRVIKVAEEIEEYLHENTRLHLDGYVTFRLHHYWQELRDLVTYAVDEYIMDKQYQEFISLLNYFVFMQDIKMPLVHVMHIGANDFELYDEQLQRLESVSTDRIVAEMLETEMNMEDMVVSNLITLSPETIYLHTRTDELPIMRTFQMIFAERLHICTDCPACRTHLGKRKDKNKTTV
jgi:putative sporulation protein YtxC